MKQTILHRNKKRSNSRRPIRPKPYWKRRRSWFCACILILVCLLPALLQEFAQRAPSAPPLITNGMGGHGEIALGEAATDNPPGYFCDYLFSVLRQFHFYVDTSSGPLPVIGVPPDYTKGQSESQSGLLMTLEEDDLANLVPVQDTNKTQDVYRLDRPYHSPRQEIICASNKTGRTAIKSILDTFYSKKGTTQSPVNGTNNQSTSGPVQWVIDGMTGFWGYLWKQIVTFIQIQVLDWANAFGFVWITPAALSYRNPMVQAGAAWATLVLDGYIALLLVIGGYQALLNQSLSLPERSSVLSSAIRVIFAALIANAGFFLLLPSMVELSNSMGMGIMVTMFLNAPGDLSLPLGGLNWLALPDSWGVFVIAYFVVSLLLIAVEAVRLAVLDVTIMLSPFWIMALANEYSRAWGRFGALTFFSALLMQPLQIACLSLGAGLIANIGHLNPNDSPICQNVPIKAHDACLLHLGNASVSSSMNIVVFVLGFATLYVAIKIPGMLFSNALRASVGSVNRDMGHMARSVMTLLFFQKELSK